MADGFYHSPEWIELSERVRARDGNRCTVGWLLGGRCSGTLHVHHIEPRRDRPDLELDEDNCATACDHHHPMWEAIRTFIQRCRRPLPPCRHVHRYRAGQEACDRARAKRLGIVLPNEDAERLVTLT